MDMKIHNKIYVFVFLIIININNKYILIYFDIIIMTRYKNDLYTIYINLANIIRLLIITFKIVDNNNNNKISINKKEMKLYIIKNMFVRKIKKISFSMKIDITFLKSFKLYSVY